MTLPYGTLVSSGSDYTMLQQVQSWIDTSKLTLTSLDPVMEETAFDLIYSRVSRAYDISSWTSQATSPALIQKAASLLIASWVYERAYAEVTAGEDNKYAMRLEDMAETIIAGIESGLLTLLDAGSQTALLPDSPEYMPSSSDDSAPVYDALGNLVNWEGSNDVKFRMSQRL